MATDQSRPAEAESVSNQLFKAAGELMFHHVHGSRLIYNSCWEDPRLDRQVMELDSDSEVVMITSAGCNALDYLLDQPAKIHTVDVNYRQNALLQLKMKMIERGNFPDLFEMFGIGSHENYREIFQEVIPQLPEWAQGFWNRNDGFFDPNSAKKSFYYQGAAGTAAWLMGVALFRAKPNIKNFALSILDSATLDQQRDVFELMEPKIWGRISSWMIRRKTIMTLLGVPGPQVKLIENDYPGGQESYVKDKLRHVLTQLPARDNYFWRVYITGSYSLNCCPEYLKQANLEPLRNRLDRINPYTGTISNFLRENPGEYSHFVLLDHLDWLAWHDYEALLEEWELIFKNSRPGTKILLRSAAMNIDFIPESVTRRLQFHPEITTPLHYIDRVGTYGSFHLATVL